MRIISRKEFLTLPSNTLFRKFSLNWFGEIQIKKCGPKDDWGNDFLSQSLDHPGGWETSEELYTIYDLIWESGNKFRMCYDSCGRDGLFEEDDVRFAIYDNEDIDQLIEELKKCKK